MKKTARGLLKLPITFYKTLYNFKYYKTLDRLKRSQAIIYIVVISLLFSIIAVIPAAIAIRNSMQDFLEMYNTNAPDFVIEDGKLNLNQTAPVYMLNDEGKAFVVVFDDTDTLTELDFREYQSILLLDSDSIFLRSPMGEQDIPYTLVFPNGTDKEAFYSYMGLVRLTNLIFVVIYIVLFILLNMLGAFFISAVGNLMLSFRRKSFIFSRSYALACYASTLPIILKTLNHVFSLNILYFDIFYVLVGVLYFWNAAKVINKSVDESPAVNR